ncbi:MAG: hypothetical protein V1689_13190, partial [Pseudomonadota bacterium]
MAIDQEHHEIVRAVMEDSRYSIAQDYYEDAVMKLQKCLQLEDEPERKATILDQLGYCFLRLGWYQDAMKVYTQYLHIYPTDNDTRFFRASAFASLKWTDEAII